MDSSESRSLIGVLNSKINVPPVRRAYAQLNAPDQPDMRAPR